MTEDQKRRWFQKVKSYSTEKFWRWQNVLHSRAYTLAENHYREAMDVVLTPKQKAAVIDKAKEIREHWDGMKEINIDETESIELREAGL